KFGNAARRFHDSEPGFSSALPADGQRRATAPCTGRRPRIRSYRTSRTDDPSARGGSGRMRVSGRAESEAFWSYQDLAIFLGLAVPCFLGGALVVKGVLRLLFISTPHRALELLPGQFLGYALLFLAL